MRRMAACIRSRPSRIASSMRSPISLEPPGIGPPGIGGRSGIGGLPRPSGLPPSGGCGPGGPHGGRGPPSRGGPTRPRPSGEPPGPRSSGGPSRSMSRSSPFAIRSSRRIISSLPVGRGPGRSSSATTHGVVVASHTTAARPTHVAAGPDHRRRPLTDARGRVPPCSTSPRPAACPRATARHPTLDDSLIMNRSWRMGRFPRP